MAASAFGSAGAGAGAVAINAAPCDAAERMRGERVETGEGRRDPGRSGGTGVESTNLLRVRGEEAEQKP